MKKIFPMDLKRLSILFVIIGIALMVVGEIGLEYYFNLDLMLIIENENLKLIYEASRHIRWVGIILTIQGGIELLSNKFMAHPVNRKKRAGIIMAIGLASLILDLGLLMIDCNLGLISWFGGFLLFRGLIEYPFYKFSKHPENHSRLVSAFLIIGGPCFLIGGGIQAYDIFVNGQGRMLIMNDDGLLVTNYFYLVGKQLYEIGFFISAIGVLEYLFQRLLQNPLEGVSIDENSTPPETLKGVEVDMVREE